MNNINKAKLELIKKLLTRDYPIVVTPLIHKNVYELFVSVLLSPQTTDEVTNKVTRELFKKYKNFNDLCNTSVEELLKYIKPINYNKTKANHLIKSSQIIINDFKGIVPSNLNNLTKLPGVGRKVGNVIINEWFSKELNKRGSPILTSDEFNLLNPWELTKVESEGFVVDTHVIRVSQRLGLTKNTDPKKIEIDLINIFDKSEYNDVSLRLIFHGRYRCKSKNDLCYLDSEWSKVCSG